ncbi:MAG: DNA mismatch repair endonuclease MutL [Gemmatimonadota bacterium]
MARIRILPDHVANQIAAGEVVERPASVVKELVENSLDAGAARVEIALRNGGKTEIRVADDGCGMEHQDALLSIDRHATSKIDSVDDLRAVSSFGFRGEALPSIAAVSRFDLETAPAGGEPGTHIRMAGGRILRVTEIARRPGTTVTVRALFQTVPARAKFLRSAAAETRSVSKEVVLLALANLAVAFRLESNGRELLHLSPAGATLERIAAIWGAEEAADLLALEASHEGVRVAGLVQRPAAARPARGRRYLFVNGRPFRDPALLRAADEAYRTTVAPGLRPSVFLYLAVPPGEVDVNVHPAKAEVRFRSRERVEEAVRKSVRERLGEAISAPSVLRESPPPPARREETLAHGGAAMPPGEAPPPAAADAPADAPEVSSQLALFVSRSAAATSNGEKAAADEGAGLAVERPDLWQLHGSYILAATRQGLLIIDQHSAHERVLYEELMALFAGAPGASQRLLFPLTLRLSPAEYTAAEELAGLLRRVGFEIEPFGDRTVIVHAVPNPHPYFDAERCFREMIDELANGSPLVDSARNQHERIAKSMACKGAIKAGQQLSGAEMEELFDRLFATELPGHDVHGRPTILRLTLDELARRFGRT